MVVMKNNYFCKALRWIFGNRCRFLLNCTKTELSEIQKQKFKELSGFDFEFTENIGEFQTPYPYNNRDWEYSPWYFKFVIEKGTNNLICELSHRMTNNRVYGWDVNGKELNDKILNKYFKSHF
jgi:hypothetical protein